MARDTYTVVHEDWEDQPSEKTPIMAKDLEHIEAGIKTAMDNRALNEVYSDDSINLGRKTGTNRGYYSAAVGVNVEASGSSSQAFGNMSAATAFCASARGNSTASGDYADASGNGTIASALGARSGGIGTKASQQAADAGGIQTEASGTGACTRGYNTKASGAFSSSEGLCTEAGGPHQHVQGRYNVVDKDGTYAHIVGGGASDTNRKNIHTLDWSGNAYYAGDVTNGAGVSLSSLKSDIDNVSAMAAGGSNAKVFDTKAELDAWLAVEGNTETLTVGQNIYIKATETPDYWWDGTGLQVLETDKVVVESMTYDETMAILNSEGEVD